MASIASKSTPKRDKDNLLSREAGLCFHTESTFIYVVPRRDELPNIAGYECHLFSRRKRRPQRAKSSLEMNLHIGKANVVKKFGAVTKSVKGKGVIYH